MDAYGFSFALGSMKPEPFFYRASCELIGADTRDYFNGNEVVMIGDSAKCDRDGPMAVGIRGCLLGRAGGKNFTTLVGFADSVLAYNGCQRERE